MKKIWETLLAIFKKYFIAGALVLVPIIVTIWVLKAIALWADSFILSLIPSGLKPEIFLEKTIPGVGIAVTIAITLLVGVITRLYFGKKLLKLGDLIISKIPIGRGVYNIVKQFLSEILTQDKKKFKGVALVQWPRAGTYMIGFITGEPPAFLARAGEGPWVNVFIPTTPNPTSGFYVVFPKKDIVPLDISVDHAFKLIISGGIFSQNNA